MCYNETYNETFKTIMCYNRQYRLDENGNTRTYMLYGHVHDIQKMINCFCMYSDYEPLALDEWIEFYRATV